MKSIQNMYAIHWIGGQMKNAIGEIVVGLIHQGCFQIDACQMAL